MDEISREKIEIVLIGKLVDSDGVPLDQLAEALAAWAEIFELLASSSIAKRLKTQPIEDSLITSQFRFRVANQGSIESIIDWVLSTDFAKGIATNLGYDLLKAAFFKLMASIKSIVEAKQVENSREDVLQQLRAAAYECGFDNVDEEQLSIFADMLEDELGRATRIVMASAESVEVRKSGETILKLDRRDAVALRIRSAAPITATQIETHLVRFNEINNRNGWGRFRFLDESRNLNKREQVCHILDSVVTAVRNPYTRALHEKQIVEVTMKLSASKSGKTQVWNIFNLQNQDGTPVDEQLF